MNKQQYEADKAILAGAPDTFYGDATHHQLTGCYVKCVDDTTWLKHRKDNNAYSLSLAFNDIRALSDIEAMCEQYERIAELEKERDALKFANNEAKEYIESELGSVFITVCPSKPFNPKKHQAIRDLRQQAKGLEDYVSKNMDNNYILHLDTSNLHHCLLINLNASALRLHKQADELEQGE